MGITANVEMDIRELFNYFGMVNVISNSGVPQGAVIVNPLTASMLQSHMNIVPGDKNVKIENTNTDDAGSPGGATDPT